MLLTMMRVLDNAMHQPPTQITPINMSGAGQEESADKTHLQVL
jgi:hypothetical protein